jgi:hypothetical protein
MRMATDWNRIRAHRFAPDAPPSDWPSNVRPISIDGVGLFGIDHTNKLYWDGKEVVLRGVRLDWFERILAICVAIGTLGLFLLELYKALWPVMV